MWNAAHPGLGSHGTFYLVLEMMDRDLYKHMSEVHCLPFNDKLGKVCRPPTAKNSVVHFV